MPRNIKKRNIEKRDRRFVDTFCVLFLPEARERNHNLRFLGVDCNRILSTLSTLHDAFPAFGKTKWARWVSYYGNLDVTRLICFVSSFSIVQADSKLVAFLCARIYRCSRAPSLTFLALSGLRQTAIIETDYASEQILYGNLYSVGLCTFPVVLLSGHIWIFIHLWRMCKTYKDFLPISNSNCKFCNIHANLVFLNVSQSLSLYILRTFLRWTNLRK